MMKIAVITDDFKTISAHFGRAKYYQVYDIVDNSVTSVEARPKSNHNHFVQQEHLHGEHDHGGAMHGMDERSQQKHNTMLDAISDCQVLLVRGMGNGAFLNAKEKSIEPIITDQHNIQSAVKAYLQGNLDNHTERLH